MNHLPSIAKLAAAIAALCLSNVAFAIGEMTCETPDAIGVTMNASAGEGGDDDVLVTRVEDAASIEVTSFEDGSGGADGLFECIVGPLPPLNGLNSVGDASGQAYIEHGLAADTSWGGLRFQLAVPEAGLAMGTDISLLALDLDAADGGSEHFVVNVQRASKHAGAELVVRRGGGDAGKEVARLPLADGAISLGWPGKAAPAAPLVIEAGGHSWAIALAPGSRARAVRIGYLGLDTARDGGDRVYVVDPTFVAR